jgi:tripeptide aminopeptidase
LGRGGLDSNWIVKHGIPSLTFGAGQHEIHTIAEYVDMKEFHAGCALAVALALGN